MEKIQISLQTRKNETSVPNRFIDNYMPTSNGDYVKIYLYLLRCVSETGKSVSISDIADCFNHTERDIIRALNYWEKMNLLSLEKDNKGEIHKIELRNLADSEEAHTSSEAKTSDEQHKQDEPEVSDEQQRWDETKILTEPKTWSEQKPPSVIISNVKLNTPIIPEDELPPLIQDYPEEEMQDFFDVPEHGELLTLLETYLKRNIKPNDVKFIYGLSTVLHFSPMLIDHLFGYCISKNKTQLPYISKVAINWYEEGITTPEDARYYSSKYNDNYIMVMKCFGLTRLPAEVERKYINLWFNKYCFSEDIIREAINRAVKKTGKPDFPYTDGILKKWYEADVTSLDMIWQMDEKYKGTTPSYTTSARKSNATPKNRSLNFTSRNYSDDEYKSLEKTLLERDRVKK